MDTTTAKLSTVTNFLRQKYATVLESMIRDIRDNTVNYSSKFILDDQKNSGISKLAIPLATNVYSGLEHAKKMLEEGTYYLTDNNTTLVVYYVRPSIGPTFITKYFEDELEPLPNRIHPCFTITLPAKVLQTLNDIPFINSSLSQNAIQELLEETWERENFGDKIKVEFMDDKNERITGDKMEFVLWFSRKLAALYFEWSKEDLPKKEEMVKIIAMTKCIVDKRPYSRFLTLDTLIRSANNKKKQRTIHPSAQARSLNMGQLADIYNGSH
jgi:hypothetical protein